MTSTALLRTESLTPARRFRVASSCLALGLLAAGACSDSDTTNASLLPGRHAISTTIFQPDGQTSLLGLVEDPAAPAVFDVGQAIEIGGSAAIFGDDGKSVFALGSSDAPTLRRYELTEDSQLIPGGALSLQAYGITSAFKRPELVPMVSATKAYWIDDTTLQVVVWNPTEMTVTGTFSLAAAEREGLLFEAGEAVVRDGLVFVSANYRLDDEGEAGEAVVLVIDTATDTLLDVATDPRCGGTLDIAPGPDGSLLFATDSFSASLYALGRPADYPEPCVLRINAGEQTFDPDYYVSMLELTEGRPAGQLVVGSDGRYYLLAFHADLLETPIGPDTEIFAPYESTAWRWWSAELGDGGAESVGSVVPDVAVRSAANRVLSAGGREYIANVDLDAGTTTLLVPQPDGGLASGLTVSGYPYGLIQLR